MGQNNSKPAGTPLSAIDQKAKDIANAVRNTAPSQPLRDPPPPSPRVARHERQPQDLWDAILRAEGPDNLSRAVEKFLEFWSVDDLLTFVAAQNHDDTSKARERFALRYMDNNDRKALSTATQAKLLARMLQDELDLPGFRFGTALQRWRKIIERYGKLHRFDEEGCAMARNSIFAFIHDLGLRRLIECLEENHGNEPGVRDSLFAIIDVDRQTGERILYEDVPNRATNNMLVATNVRDWLIREAPLSFALSETGLTPSREAWVVDLWHEPNPADEDESLISIVKATKSKHSPWSGAYNRLLRHAELFGIEGLLEAVLESFRECDLETWMSRSAEEWLADVRRQRPLERLAAVIADSMVTVHREKKRVFELKAKAPVQQAKAGQKTTENQTASAQLPGDGNGRPSIDESPAPQNGIRRTPQLNLNTRPETTQETQVEEDLNNSAPPYKPRQIHDPSITESLYDQLLEEITDLLVTQGELKALISTLMDDITDLQAQVDNETQQQKPRHCPICGLYLMDEEAERRHMATHRDELNKCRARNGLSPYGIDQPPNFAKKKRGGSPSKQGPLEDRSPVGRRSKSRETEDKQGSPPTQDEPMLVDSSSPNAAIGLGISFDSSPKSKSKTPEKEHATPPTSPDAGPPVATWPKPKGTGSSKGPRSRTKSTTPGDESTPRLPKRRSLKAVEISPPILDADEELSDIVIQTPAAPKRGRRKKEPSTLEEFLGMRGQTMKRRKK